jgi:hypothetical protein
MTAQMSDRFIYRGEQYALAGVNGEGLFDPKEHGLQPVATCTACWRGFRCIYEVRDGRLLLRALQINHGVKEEEGAWGRPTDAPELWGREPTSGGEGFSFFHSVYENLDHVVSFTGGLLLARGFHSEFYVHMGFHPAWKFSEVHELMFEDGRLTEAADRSAEMAKLREGVEGAGECEDPSRLSEWIKRCFSLEYKW